jgi:peptidoglycan/LPS O-acetylase OafA/YrhL
MSGKSVERYPFRGDIEALRGLAVLAVLIYHLWPSFLPGGYAGVDVFFVISGYVVTYALLARQGNKQAAPISVVSFLQRRLRRILPPLLLTVVLISAVSYLIYDKRLFHSFSGYAITSLFGVSNISLIFRQTNYFSPDQELNPFLHTWSLGIEEQFYLLYPLLFLQLLRRLNSRWLWLGLLALTLASLFIGLHWSIQVPERAYLSPISRFWEMATGVLLALAGTAVWPRFKHFFGQYSGPISGKWLSYLQWPALLALLCAFVLLSDQGSYPLPGVLLPVAATVLLLLAGEASVAPLLAQLLPLRWLGKISYSLYLYHWPCIVFSRYMLGTASGLWWPVAVALALLFAWASSRWLEQVWCKRASRRQLAVGVAVTSAVVISFDGLADPLRQPFGLAAFSRLAWAADDSRPLAELLGSARPAGLGEAQALQLDPLLMKQLVPGAGLNITLVRGGVSLARPVPDLVAKAKRRWFVVGDSHAGSMLAAMRSVVAARSGSLALVVTPPGLGGCSLVSYSFDPARCTAYERDALALVQRWAKPGDVLLLPSLRLPRHSAGAAFKLYEDPATPYVGKSMRPALQRLIGRGVASYLIAPWPVFNVLGKQCLGWQGLLKLDCNKLRHQVEQESAPARRRLQLLQAQLPGLGIIDPLPLFCPAKLCANHRNNLPLLADHDHLSGYGSAALGLWLLDQDQLR